MVVSLMLLARSLRAAERLSEDLAGSPVLKGLKRRLPDSTLGDFLAEVSPAALRHHVHRHILAEHRRKALEPTVLPIRAAAIDGKRGAYVSTEGGRRFKAGGWTGGDPKVPAGFGQ